MRGALPGEATSRLDVKHEFPDQGLILSGKLSRQVGRLQRIVVKMVELIGFKRRILNELPRALAQRIVISSAVAHAALAAQPDQGSIKAPLRLSQEGGEERNAIKAGGRRDVGDLAECGVKVHGHSHQVAS